MTISLLESQKIPVSPNPKYCFLGNANRLKHYAVHLAQNENSSDTERMSFAIENNTTNFTENSPGTGTARILPAGSLVRPLHYRHLQEVQTKALQTYSNYVAQVSLSSLANDNLSWWIRNLPQLKGSPILTPTADLVISDASKSGWSVVEQSPVGRQVERSRSPASHQHSGTSSSLFCSQIISFECTKQGGLSKNGQHHGLHKLLYIIVYYLYK